MLKLQTPKMVKTYGLTALAAGFVFITAPVAADASNFGSENLNDGIENEHVERLQEMLIEEEYLTDEDATGVYDEATAGAITSFQEEVNLLVDGVAGTQTLGALSVLEKGDENALVEDLQGNLKGYGYYTGTLDGIFGPLTEDAVKSFQSDADISADGMAGPKTYVALSNFEMTATTEEASETTSETEETGTETEETEPESSGEETAAASSNEESEPSSSEAPEGETIQMEATAYTAYCDGCSGITATGIDLRNDPNANVVAVDPQVIPLGSRVYVEGYGEAIAGDTGGAINGNKIDLHVPTRDEALNFGRQTVNVTLLD